MMPIGKRVAVKLGAIALLGLLTMPQSAAADRVIYASVDGKAGYDGAGRQDPRGLTLQAAIVEAARDLSQPITIQLLTSQQSMPTTYRASVDVCAFTMDDIKRPEGKEITIQGVRPAEDRW